MATYRYTAIDSQSKVREGICQAASRAQAIAKISSNGSRVLKLQQDRKQPTARKVGRAAVTRLFDMLGEQLHGGVPLLEALQVVSQQESNESVSRLVQQVSQAVESGEPLSSAMRAEPQAFSRTEISLVTAGEEGGFLAEALQRIAAMREWQQQLTSSVWAAAAYPLLLLTVAAIVVPCVIVFLVPQLEPVFTSLSKESQLPWATSCLLGFSTLLRQQAGLLLIALAALLLGVKLAFRSPKLRTQLDRLSLKVPVLGNLQRDFKLARYFRVLGELLKHNVAVVSSLNIALHTLGNRALHRSLEKTADAVAYGQSLSQTLRESEAVPLDAISLLTVGERTNRLDESLLRVAMQLESRTRRQVDTAVKLIEPLLLIALALFIAFVAVALLMPIFEGQALG